MRVLKRLIIGTFCFSLLTSGATVSAASDEQVSSDMVQQLAEEAEKLDPESEESVDKFAELLDNWDIEAEEWSEESDTLSGTMSNVLPDSSGGSIQLIFAQIQQQQNQICKDQANKYIEEIQRYQDNQKKCVELISSLREFQRSAFQDKNSQPLPEEIKNLLIELEICTANDEVINKDVTEQEVVLLLTYAINKQDSLSKKEQHLMDNLQDFIGQYQALVQQINDQSASAVEYQESLSGGTMLGGSVGLLFTGILLGACAGIVIMIVVHKAGKKKV